jgi:4-hydroxy 2-oxovalerate aldolase
MNDINILDCTIRDGSYSVNFQFTKDDITTIVHALASANVKYIEVGHGLGLGAYNMKGKEACVNDIETIQVSKEASNNLNAKIGVFFIPGIGTFDDIKIAQQEGADFIRIGINSFEYKKALPYITYAKTLGMEVGFNFMKSYLLNPYTLLQHAKNIASEGVDYIYVVDSAGGMLPQDVGSIIRLLNENIETSIGFHGHNNLMLANANNIIAIENGANMIDTTLFGIGRGGGNSSTEIMLFILEKIGIKLDINRNLLMDTSAKYIAPRMMDKNLTDIDIVSGFALFHSSFIDLFKNVSGRLNVDLRDLIIEVSKIDNANPNQNLIEEIGVELLNKKKAIHTPVNIIGKIDDK